MRDPGTGPGPGPDRGQGQGRDVPQRALMHATRFRGLGRHSEQPSSGARRRTVAAVSRLRYGLERPVGSVAGRRADMSRHGYDREGPDAAVQAELRLAYGLALSRMDQGQQN